MKYSFCGKEPACKCRRHKRQGFDPWVREILWRTAWQPTPVFLPGESHGQRSLVGYSPRGRTESDTMKRLSMAHSVKQGGRAVVSAFGIRGNWNLSNHSSKGGELNESNWSSQYPKVGNLDKSQARPVNLDKEASWLCSLESRGPSSSLESQGPSFSQLLQERRMSCSPAGPWSQIPGFTSQLCHFLFSLFASVSLTVNAWVSFRSVRSR